MAETIFSQIIRGEIKVDILHDDDQVLAFRDIAPQGPVHILVIPKKEIATTNDIAEEDEVLVGHMIRVATDLAESEGIAATGYRLVINCNHDGGQDIHHLHVHLIGGRKMTWPPG
jgi:histidine triad (HIT) family protein